MASQWGKYLELSIFGESHGKGLGIVMGRLPAGLALDFDFIRSEMARRAPGQSALTTPRREGDNFEILSGELKGRTTGAPLTAFIANSNTRSGDYSDLETLMRPGHADYPAHVKYKGYNDVRGGGHFSGRITAALVFAGAVAKSYLKHRGILIAGRIASIKDIEDAPMPEPDRPLLEKFLKQSFPLLTETLRKKMEAEILGAKNAGDSVGGTVEVCAIGVPAGLGEPFFYSLESSLASLIFSIPAIKGLEFGLGFGLSRLNGSEANDLYGCQEGVILPLSGKQGGILGGISNGGAICFRAAVKPTASIALPQATVNIKTKTSGVLSVKGRHDPCIVPRVVPVLEAAAALCLMDMILGESHGD